MKKSPDFDLATKLKELERIEQYFHGAPEDPMEAIKMHKQALEIAKEIKDYLNKAETELIALNSKA